MRKTTALGASLLLILFAFTACKPKVGGVAAKTQDLLTLVPASVQGVFLMDIQNGLKVQAVSDMLKKEEAQAKLKEFTEKTGIDPLKDIRFLAIGFQTGASPDDQEGVGILNLSYNKDTLLASLKKQGEVKEVQYQGFTVYVLDSEEGKPPMHGVFLDESNIVAGSPKTVEAVIDIYKGQKDSLHKNAELMGLVREANKAALIWGIFLIPADTLAKAGSQMPMLSGLEALKSGILAVDYQNKNILIEVKAKGKDEAKLKQIADMLNGLKAFGAMAAATKPEIGEVVNKLEITSGKDFVRIYASLPEELIKKLAAEAAKPKPVEVPQEEIPQDLPDQQ
jgi:hypothetical protein